MKTLITLIIILLLIALGLYFWLPSGRYSPLQDGQPPQPAPAAALPPPPPAAPDSTQSINKDVDSIDLGDLGKDLQEVDQDIQGL